MRNEVITHDGVVKSIEDEGVCVTILQSSACAGCAAKTLCSSAEAKEKEVVVRNTAHATLRVGQKVKLEGRLSDGRMAAIIAYGLPLLLMLPVLYAATTISGSETVGALCALLIVAAYYAVIALCFRNRLQTQFAFSIKQEEESPRPTI